MANNLKDIVRRHVEIETLKEFLGEEYESTLNERKESLLDTLRSRGEIDREVDQIIEIFYRETEANSGRKARRFKTRLIYSILSILFTIGIAYGVNNEMWVMIILIAIINVISIVWFMVQEE